MVKLKNFIRRYTSIAATIDILRRKELPILDPLLVGMTANDRHFMDQYKKNKELGGLYGLCAATCSETYHHWRVFTNSADGACIEIKRQEFEAQLEEIEGVRGTVRSNTSNLKTLRNLALRIGSECLSSKE